MTDILTLVLISIPSAIITDDSHLSTSSDPPPSYTTYPEDDRDRVVSPYSDSSSNSSCALLPLSPGPKTPLDKDSSAQSTPRSTPVHIDFINHPSDIEMRHDEIPIHDERANTSNIQNERDTFLFLFCSFFSHVRPLTGESSLSLLMAIRI